MKTEFRIFVEKHVAEVSRLERDKNLAYWRAATGGKDKDYRELAELQFKISRIYSGKADFEYLSDFMESGEDLDGHLARTARILYLTYRGMQMGENLLRETSELSSSIQMKFNTFRPSIGGREVSDNDIREILADESDSEKRREAWEAHKKVGEEVAPGLVQLVELRNRGAAEAGFDDFYAMSLCLSETDEQELFDLMDRMDEL
ncbi:MAG: hypothetical protein GF417_05545, partial [Candidatus Latescibacteria bacterium]|nr:hypothetical protein [bacterium]MBD3423879.1 hypothetical protein [Candidatus Latescibacterota bacterium]